MNKKSNKTERICFRLTMELGEQLVQLSKELGITKTEIIERGIKKQL